MSTVPFQFSDFVKVFSLSLILTVLFMALFQVFPGAAGFLDGLHPSVAFLFSYLIQFAILFFPLWFFVVDKYGVGLKDFGFERIKASKLIGNVAMIYAIYLVFAIAFGLILHFTGSELPGYGQQDSYVPVFGDDGLGIFVGGALCDFCGAFH